MHNCTMIINWVFPRCQREYCYMQNYAIYIDLSGQYNQTCLDFAWARSRTDATNMRDVEAI